MRYGTGVLALMAAGFFASQTFADDLCYAMQGQFADARYCVTSVRAPETDTNFGPEHLLATGNGAWCAGAERNQVVTMYLKPAPLLRTVTMTNGYAKSAETFRQNGRVKRVMLETDNGYKSMITLRDTTAVQKIIIPKGRYAWIRLTILEAMRGATNPNPCLSEFLVNLEEFGNN